MSTKQLHAPNPSVALSNAVDQVKSGFGDVAQSVADAFGRGKESAVGQFDAGREAVTGYARDNPLRAIGVAALAGIALGIIFFRR